MREFKASTGEIFSGKELRYAINKVADWYEENARAIYKENAYAPHVSESEKSHFMNQQLEFARQMRLGDDKALSSFAVRQRINLELTGFCPPFLK